VTGLSTKIASLSDKVTGLSDKITVLSEKFTRLDKNVFIIKWQMNALLVAVIGFTGVS